MVSSPTKHLWSLRADKSCAQIICARTSSATIELLNVFLNHLDFVRYYWQCDDNSVVAKWKMFLGIYVMNENTNQTCQLLSAKELSKILSTQKSLPEELAAELIAIWIYSQSPTLCQAEYKQALRLFESTLIKYLAVKSFDGCQVDTRDSHRFFSWHHAWLRILGDTRGILGGILGTVTVFFLDTTLD